MNETAKEYGRCPLGCDLDDKQIVTGYDRLYHLPGKFNVVQCNGCKLLRTNPRPSSENIGEYYPPEYGPHQNSFSSSKKLKTVRNYIKKTAIGRLISKIATGEEHIVPYLSEGANVLELGFGNAKFLLAMKRYSFNLHGLEFNEQMVNLAKAQGINAVQGNLEDVKYSSEYFDIVYAWQVVEHLFDPVQTIYEVHRIMKKGGYFIFGIPNINSWEFKVFRANWYALDLPRHLYHFSPSTIEAVLNKCGFDEIQINHQTSITNILMSTIYIIEKMFNHKRMTKLRNIAKRSLFMRIAVKPWSMVLGKMFGSGRIEIIARKT